MAEQPRVIKPHSDLDLEAVRTRFSEWIQLATEKRWKVPERNSNHVVMTILPNEFIWALIGGIFGPPIYLSYQFPGSFVNVIGSVVCVFVVIALCFWASRNPVTIRAEIMQDAPFSVEVKSKAKIPSTNAIIDSLAEILTEA